MELWYWYLYYCGGRAHLERYNGGGREWDREQCGHGKRPLNHGHAVPSPYIFRADYKYKCWILALSWAAMLLEWIMINCCQLFHFRTGAWVVEHLRITSDNMAYSLLSYCSSGSYSRWEWACWCVNDGLQWRRGTNPSFDLPVASVIIRSGVVVIPSTLHVVTWLVMAPN